MAIDVEKVVGFGTNDTLVALSELSEPIYERKF